MALARKSVLHNVGTLDGRVTLVRGDLRAPEALGPAPEPFDLITGTPPYWRVRVLVSEGKVDAGASGTSSAGGERDEASNLVTLPSEGSITAHGEDAPARCCFRGEVGDYALAAARWLAPTPSARFVVVDSALHDDRVADAARAAHLRPVYCLTVRGREGKPPLIRVWAFRRARPGDPPGPALMRQEAFPGAEADGGEACASVDVSVRGADGLRTPAYVQLMLDMGIPRG